ncbi:hypothetical protein [Rhizobium chutanense]|uniref:hypothetical protein n=1 Tax=Rhizobium chutanense TaxID=2035448 RepID=UPI0015CF78DD|nr:hypothetical protein [Rhizobium chutanense]
MSFSLGRLIEPPSFGLWAVPACRLRAASRKGDFAAAKTLHDSTIVSRALAAFALRGWGKVARETTGKESREEEA